MKSIQDLVKNVTTVKEFYVKDKESIEACQLLINFIFADVEGEYEFGAKILNESNPVHKQILETIGAFGAIGIIEMLTTSDNPLEGVGKINISLFPDAIVIIDEKFIKYSYRVVNGKLNLITCGKISDSPMTMRLANIKISGKMVDEERMNMIYETIMGDPLVKEHLKDNQEVAVAIEGLIDAKFYALAIQLIFDIAASIPFEVVANGIEYTISTDANELMDVGIFTREEAETFGKEYTMLDEASILTPSKTIEIVKAKLGVDVKKKEIKVAVTE